MNLQRHLGPLEVALWLAVSFGPGCSAGKPRTGAGGEGNASGSGGDGAGDSGGQPNGGGGASGSGGEVQPGGDGGNGASSAGGSGGGAGQTGGGSGGAPAAAGQGGGKADGLEPCATHPYCNDFENTAVGARPLGFLNVGAGNKLGVTEDKFYAGKRSLAIEAVSGEARYTVYLRDRLPNPQRIGYARMMVWLDNLPGSGGAHWNMIAMSGQTKIPQGNANASIAFGGTSNNGNNWYLYLGGAQAGIGQDCTKSVTPPQFPLKQWVCVELKVDETTTQNYQVWVNKQEITQLSLRWNATGANCVGGASNIWYIPDVATFSFGWNHYHAQGAPIKMWIDDVVVAEKPIGCPP